MTDGAGSLPARCKREGAHCSAPTACHPSPSWVRAAEDQRPFAAGQQRAVVTRSRAGLDSQLAASACTGGKLVVESRIFCVEMPDKSEDSIEYEVEAVVATRRRSGGVEYRVHWKGYSPDDDTWEPPRNLQGNAQLKEFLAHQRQRAAAAKLPSRRCDDNPLAVAKRPVAGCATPATSKRKQKEATTGRQPRKKSKLGAAGSRALDNETIAGMAFVHTPPGRTKPTLGSVQFVLPDAFPRTARAKVVVMYTDTDDTLENTIIDGRARTDSPVEAPLTFEELDEVLAQPCHTLQQLQQLANPHTLIFEDEGRLYATDKDVLPAVVGAAAGPPRPLFGLIIGKVPAPPCIRGRFWNCSQGRVWKSFLMGRPSLSSSRNLSKWDAAVDANATTYVPWNEETFLGRGPFHDEALTDHGWGCTDLTQRPRPFANNPNRKQVIAGWRRIERDILQLESGGGPKLLFFVYKKVLDRVLAEVFGCGDVVTKHGMNDQLSDRVRALFGPQKPHIFVFPMPGKLPSGPGQSTCSCTGKKLHPEPHMLLCACARRAGTQCTFKKPVAKGKVYCDKGTEQRKLSLVYDAWRATSSG